MNGDEFEKIEKQVWKSFRQLRPCDKWVVSLQIAQTGIMFLTLLAALFIGVTQNRINDDLYKLQARPSIEVEYDYGELQIFNRGTQNLWFWGTKVDDLDARIEEDPSLVAAGGSHRIEESRIREQIEGKETVEGSVRVNVDIFLANEDREEYVARVLFRASDFNVMPYRVDARIVSLQKRAWRPSVLGHQ